MSTLANILAAWKLSDKLVWVVVSFIAGALAMSAYHCGKGRQSAAVITDTLYVGPDTTIITQTDTVTNYIAIIKPLINGDSIKYFEYKDANLAVNFNYRSGFVSDFDYSIFREQKTLYIRDTTIITEKFADSATTTTPVIFHNNEIPLIQLAAHIELAASPLPETAFLLGAEGSLRVDKVTVFLRPQYIYPDGAYIWGGLKWALY